MTPSRRTIEVTDARALRALAHPVRLSLIGLLRREGPLTATQAGEILSESATTCSFHLRQLAKYGLVEEAGGGRGRARPWRATASFTSWAGIAADPEVSAAAEALIAVVARRYFDQLLTYLGRRTDEPVGWREAVELGDTLVHLTADELLDLNKRVSELLEPYFDRLAQPELRPSDSRLVMVLRLAFPAEAPRP